MDDKPVTPRRRSGGPQTEEGKAISSMNGIKHGKYIKHFNRIDGRYAGRMKICAPCGEEQQLACIQDECCQLHAELVYRYHMAYSENDPSYIEEFTVNQLATMDMLFNQKLLWLLQNEGEMDERFSKDGKKYFVPRVTHQDYFLLMNMANNLAKTLPDMQLTRATQESADVAFAMLLQSKVDPRRAEELRLKMIESATHFSEAQGAAKEMQEQDAAIQNWIHQEKKAEGSGRTARLKDIGDSPFGEEKQ